MEDDSKQFTESLVAHSRGDSSATERLFSDLYDRLRRLAGRYVRDERRRISLEPTEIVHEAYLRLVEIDQITWKDKSHFLAMAATQMRRVLVDQARRRHSQKRGGGIRLVSFPPELAGENTHPLDILTVDDALDRLARRKARLGQVAELRLFAGMSVKEIAHVLEVSPRTVRDDWQFARAWLAREMKSGRRQA